MPYMVLFFLSSAWLIFLIFLAYIQNPSFWYKLVFSLIGITCHQTPHKSFYFVHHQIPVCARCFGVYSGFFLALLFYPLFCSIKNRKVPSLKFAWIFIAPIFIDGAFDILPDNTGRMITGLIFGAGVMIYLLPALNDIHYSQHTKE